MIVDAYETVGHKDPKWDDQARRALRAYAASWGDDPLTDFDEMWVGDDATRRATEAGCDDLLVLSVVPHFTVLFGVDTYDRRFMNLSRQFRASNPPGRYPAVLRCFTYALAAHQVSGRRGGLRPDGRVGAARLEFRSAAAALMRLSSAEGIRAAG